MSSSGKDKKKFESASSSSSDSGNNSSDDSEHTRNMKRRDRAKKHKQSRKSSSSSSESGSDNKNSDDCRKRQKKKYKKEQTGGHRKSYSGSESDVATSTHKSSKAKDAKHEDQDKRYNNRDRAQGDNRRYNDDRNHQRGSNNYNNRDDKNYDQRRDNRRHHDYRNKDNYNRGRNNNDRNRNNDDRVRNNEDRERNYSRDNNDNRNRNNDNNSRGRNRSPFRGRKNDRQGGNNRRNRSRSFDHASAKWGKNVEDSSKDKAGPAEKQKPNFGLSGKLTEETNTYKGVVIKYSEPPEARKPRRRWRLYPFKGEKALQTLYIHRESGYLIGRERKIVDLPVDHPSCSKQHAALQYRLVPFTRDDGSAGKRVRPYIIDLDSANGTFINNKKIEPKKYVELLERDVIKFGFSSREYVLLHENSKDEAMDDDVKIEEEEVAVKAEVHD